MVDWRNSLVVEERSLYPPPRSDRSAHVPRTVPRHNHPEKATKYVRAAARFYGCATFWMWVNTISRPSAPHSISIAVSPIICRVTIGNNNNWLGRCGVPAHTSCCHVTTVPSPRASAD